jgi:glycosyltransferase involved in cell wall biosynthesis
MNHPYTLSIFFPTYNEEKNIESSVYEAIKVAEGSPYVGAYEILIINDGSSDKTRAIAARLAEQFPQVRLINHAANRGYGAALKTGMAEARMDYIFFTDADLQFDIIELQNLLVRLPEYPVVIGYRAPRVDPFMRLLNAKVWNILNRILFGLKVRDIDCAFKIFRRDLVQGLKLRSQGAMINAEILIKLSRKRVPMKEVPVSHLPRTAGSPTGAKPSVILRALREMVTLYGGELGSVTHKQALKFGVVGVINTLLDATVYFLLTRAVPYFPEHVVTAKLLSFLVGTVSSFALNRTWTFGMRSRVNTGEIVRFYATVSASLFANVSAMYVFVHVLHLHDLTALVLSTVFSFLINFTLSKTWVFKKQSYEQPA